MKRILRYLIAIIFIVSGFVKAVDPVGFSFKLEEYFSPSVFNIPFLEQFALPIAVFVVALELILGVMLLLKIKLRSTLISLISLCVFFGFLTFYSAYFHVVTDCGCFGDAIKFTPWQSFWKDIALLAGLILLWVLNKKSGSLSNEKSCLKLPILGVFILVTIFIIYRGIKHEPLIDFRDYKIGTDLNAERQKIRKNPSEYKTIYTLKNTQNGQTVEVNQDDYINKKEYWEEGTPWKIESDKNKSMLVKQGYISAIDKLKLEDETGNDLTDQILQMSEVYLLFTYQPKEAGAGNLAKYETELQTKFGKNVYGVSTDKNTFTKIPNLTMDGTAIKTIARSNPFVLVLHKGKIVEKKNAEDFIK
ncbi:MAG: DoxX family protein [Cloacibacterium sp.]|nr:DoxX family protein [Cloacibacterium sp.]